MSLMELFEGEDWRESARCKGMDPDLFHPERGSWKQMEEAKAICAQCPVQTHCLEYAITSNEKIGIWGGTAEVERRKIRRARGLYFNDTPRYYPRYERQRPIRPAECGTSAGYERHRKLREPACIDCKEANRLKTIHYRNLKKT